MSYFHQVSKCPNVHNVVVAISCGGGMTVWRNAWVAGTLYGMKSDGKMSDGEMSDGEMLCDIMSGG